MLRTLLDRLASLLGWECCEGDSLRPGFGIWLDLETEAWHFAFGSWGFALQRGPEKQQARIRREMARIEAETAARKAAKTARRASRRVA
jgi:hypothetical protein